VILQGAAAAAAGDPQETRRRQQSQPGEGSQKYIRWVSSWDKVESRIGRKESRGRTAGDSRARLEKEIIFISGEEKYGQSKGFDSQTKSQQVSKRPEKNWVDNESCQKIEETGGRVIFLPLTHVAELPKAFKDTGEAARHCVSTSLKSQLSSIEWTPTSSESARRHTEFMCEFSMDRRSQSK
jgi:hypothetical protein